MYADMAHACRTAPALRETSRAKASADPRKTKQARKQTHTHERFALWNFSQFKGTKSLGIFHLHP